VNWELAHTVPCMIVFSLHDLVNPRNHVQLGTCTSPITTNSAIELVCQVMRGTWFQ